MTYDLTQKDILVILYHKQAKYDETAIPTGQSWKISQDFSLTHDNSEQTKFFLSLPVIWRELDTTTALGVPAPLSYTIQVPTNIIATFHSVAPAIPSGLAPLSQGLSQLLLTKETTNNQYNLTGTIVSIEARGQNNHYLNTGESGLDEFMNYLDKIHQETSFGQVLVNYYTTDWYYDYFVITGILKLTPNQYTVITYTSKTIPVSAASNREFNGIKLPCHRSCKTDPLTII
ncbi:hypothetical protein [Arsenophonus nasoniae]|uniref:Uncharacterized protein n=1 Tax=Arsenophonus nasoniae TaxID=638 RepID=A0AA95K1A4_9GAMM|nr:hypothetical protein [Arsenophonus nasoniae]WGL96419.1 hypothetical protein QE207_07685 [Arsenophonus nasoniae]